MLNDVLNVACTERGFQENALTEAFVDLADATVAISAQIEAAVKACEAETSKAGQDYYTAVAASGPAAGKRPPSASKGPAPASGKAGKDEASVASEVSMTMEAPLLSSSFLPPLLCCTRAMLHQREQHYKWSQLL